MHNHWLISFYMRGLLMVLCTGFAVPAKCAAQAQNQKSPPNILLILVDDLGYSDVGAMGGEIPTPNIDRLASGGLRFTQCYNSARCCPSRASLMTGLYPHQAGIGSFATSRPSAEKGPAYLGHLNDQCVTLAEALRGANYQTYMVGKWHMEEPGPIARGFDEFYGFVHGYEQNQWDPARYTRLPTERQQELQFAPGNFYATDAFTDFALEFLRQARTHSGEDEPRPWFLYVAHSAPHFPIQAPRETVKKFVDTYRRGWDALRTERYQRMLASGLAEKSWTLTDRSVVPVDEDVIANGFSGEQNPAWEDLPDDRREDLAHRMAIFAAMVSHVDDGVGRLLADLEANNELDNTLILFLSDNGACYEWGPFGFDGPSRQANTRLHHGDRLASMGGPGTYHAYGSGWANLGNTPLRMYKHFTYEGGNCTPLFAHWPAGIQTPDRWVRQPVHVMDVMPTLCAIASADYPTQRNGVQTLPLEGTSLTPVFAGETLPERSIASEHNESCSLRHGDWKVVRPVRMPWNSGWELYNIADDRCETTNLAEQYPELTQELAAEWKAWAERTQVYPVYNPNPGKDGSSPQIDQRPLTITADVSLPTADDNAVNATGVIVAQGGRQHGFALHLQDGQLIFSVRVSGEVTATRPYALKSPQAHIEAKLLTDAELELRVDGELVSQAQAPGLIPAQPIDGLSIGRDTQTAVGDYRAPLPLQGEVTNVKVNGQQVEKNEH